MAKVNEEKRADDFCEQISTEIWREKASPDNAYLVDEVRCHGYDHLALINHKSLSEVIYLLMQGELPNDGQKILFERLLISLINPGPRHNATRAVMNAAVSRTHISHLLPIGLTVLGGENQGSHDVFKAMKYLQRSQAKCPAETAAGLSDHCAPEAGDQHLVPGFGSLYGTQDCYSKKLLANLESTGHTGQYVAWANQFVTALVQPHCGWLISGVAAAVLLDLGFSPHQGELVYQLARLPGLAAHGAEKFAKPITDMPFIAEDNYVIDN
ncbi:MAG: hypothetical protein V7739_11205 [Motiliproteus sp.]